MGETIHVFKHIPYIAAELDPNDARRIAERIYGSGQFYGRMLHTSFERIRGIDVVSEFRIPKTSPSPNKYAREKHLWNLENIGAYDALQHATGKGVRVGVIDTGIDYTHPELSGRFTRTKGIDLVDGKDPMDQEGHGTHVAGTVAGESVGIARKCDLYAIRVLDENGSGSEIAVMQGIEWALENRIDVVNMSLGSGYATRAFEELCDYASTNGLVLVAAAGNEGGEYASYPAAFGDSVISVAAVDKRNKHADFSNVYPTNDISAPGVGIFSSFPGSRYREMDGTSMATPHITGSIALALERFEGEDIEYELKRTAQSLGRHEYFGAGLVRADALASSMQRYQQKQGILERLLTL